MVSDFPAAQKKERELDKINNDTYWTDAINRELSAIWSYGTFEPISKKEMVNLKAKEGYQHAPVWMIFDMKKDLHRNAILVIVEYVVYQKGNDVYAIHMKVESARMLMVIVDANDMDVADERIVTLLGKEFYDAGLTSSPQQRSRVAKAQYGLSFSSHKWWKILSDTLIQLDYKRSRGDKDIWMRLNKSKTMYDYIGTHTDNLLVRKAIFDELESSFEFKTISEPEYHLGIDYIK